MNVAAILRSKGASVVTAGADWTVTELALRMRAERIGALVVSGDGATIEGIVSERDVAHALAEHGERVHALHVRDVMHREVITCAPEDGIELVMAKMTRHRIRHLPVVGGGRLTGIVSIGDVVKHRLDELESEAAALRDYIAGH